MSFIWPPMLIFLLLIPLFVLLYLRMQWRRRQLVAGFGGLMVTSGGAARLLGVRRHLPPLIFLIALVILIIALARPQAVISVPRIEGTVILAFDVSGSMAADDLAPTRMEAAKAAAQAFVENEPPTVRIGVVAFSESGMAVQQPTYNQDDILAAIHRLDPSRGTSLGSGLLAALDIIETDGQENTSYYSNLTPEPTLEPTPVPQGFHTANAIVLLSDGENTDQPDPMEAAQAAADRGVRIYTIGVGSTAGTTLNVEGFNVFTQLDEALLQQISQLSGGSYYQAESREELLDIYTSLDRELVIKPEPMEVTPVFAGASILILLVGAALSLLWFGRVP